MKRLGVVVVLLALFSVTDFAVAQNNQMPENTLPENYKIQPPASEMPPVPIDGVDVPHEVLTYAQIAYQGYAVTQAKETTWNGVKAYQLRIDNDSNPNDNNGMYLLYGADWKLIDEKPYYAPLPYNRHVEVKVPVEEPEPEIIEVPEVEEIEEPEPEEDEKPEKPEDPPVEPEPEDSREP